MLNRNRAQHNSPSGESFRSSLDHLLLRMVGQVDSGLLWELKYFLNKFEQHNIAKLAQLNLRLAQQSDIQLKITAVTSLAQTLDCRLLVAMKEGGANHSALESMRVLLHEMGDELSNIGGAAPGGPAHRSATERLAIERRNFEMSCKGRAKGSSEQWKRCDSGSCKARFKQFLAKNADLVRQICALEQQLLHKEARLCELQQYIERLRTELDRPASSESDIGSPRQGSSQLSKSHLDDQELLQKIEATIQEAVGKVIRSEKEEEAPQPTRERMFTLSNKDGEREGKDEKQPVRQQQIYQIGDGQLFRMLLAQAATLEELLPRGYRFRVAQ